MSVFNYYLNLKFSLKLNLIQELVLRLKGGKALIFYYLYLNKKYNRNYLIFLYRVSFTNKKDGNA